MEAIKQKLLNTIHVVKPIAQKILNIVFAISVITLSALNTQFKNELIDVNNNINTLKKAQVTNTISASTLMQIKVDDMQIKVDDLKDDLEYELDDLENRISNNERIIKNVRWDLDMQPSSEIYKLSDASYYDFVQNINFRRAVKDQIKENLDYGDDVSNKVVSIVKQTVDDYCVVEIDNNGYYLRTSLYCN